MKDGWNLAMNISPATGMDLEYHDEEERNRRISLIDVRLGKYLARRVSPYRGS